MGNVGIDEVQLAELYIYVSRQTSQRHGIHDGMAHTMAWHTHDDGMAHTTMSAGRRPHP